MGLVGVLMGHYLLTERPNVAGEKPLVLASIVSSPMLGTIASALGVRYEETLTGFKWIANLAMDPPATGPPHAVCTFVLFTAYSTASRQ